MLVLNGTPVTLPPGTSPTMTLLDWLRGPAALTGTKEGCAEGDCGACTVVLATSRDGVDLAAPSMPASLLLGQLDGRRCCTVEGLRGADGALHPVQQALVEAMARNAASAPRASSCRCRALHDRGDARRTRCTRRWPATSAAAPATARSSMRRLLRTAARRYDGRPSRRCAAAAARPSRRDGQSSSTAPRDRGRIARAALRDIPSHAARRRHRSRPAGQRAPAAPARVIGLLGVPELRGASSADAATACTIGAARDLCARCCRCWTALDPASAPSCRGSARGRSARSARSAAISPTPRPSATRCRRCSRSARSLRFASAARAARTSARGFPARLPQDRRWQPDEVIVSHPSAAARRRRAFRRVEDLEALRPGHLGRLRRLPAARRGRPHREARARLRRHGRDAGARRGMPRPR